MRKIAPVFFLIFILSVIGPVTAQDTELLTISDSNELLATLGVVAGISDDNLEDLVVFVDEPGAGVVSPYQISFRLNIGICELIRSGGFKFAFPDGFDLGHIYDIEIFDDNELFDLEVDGIGVSGQLLTVRIQQAPEDEEIDFEEFGGEFIAISLHINDIGNPEVVGDYQIAGVAFKKNGAVIAGPTLSAPFTIEPNNLQSIVVSPQDDFTLRAGENFTFSAEGFDQFGNKIDGLVYTWSLDCDNCIGFFTDSTLTATTFGQAHAVASFGDIYGTSGLVAVIPGDLNRMDLLVSDTQFVGNPLRGSGSIALYDAFDNPKIDYSLSMQPVSLVSSSGLFDPDALSDDGLLVDGVVQILSAGLTYFGLSGTIDVEAGNGQVTSNAVPVSFNGYDLLDVLDFGGSTISTMFADGPNIVMPVVRLDGNIRPSGKVALTARMTSDATDQILFFDPGDLGDEDTLQFDLQSIYPEPDEDTLVVLLEADYDINGVTYTAVDSARFPVSVITAVDFEVVEGTIKPDTMVAGHGVNLSFDITGSGSVDSVLAIVYLKDSQNPDYILSTLFNGMIIPSANGDGTFSLVNMIGSVPGDLEIASGFFPLSIKGNVFASSGVTNLLNSFPDSAFVIAPVEIGVDPASVSPTTVSAGSSAALRFVATLSSDFPLGYEVEASLFAVTDGGYFTSTSLTLIGDEIVPGDNEFVSETFFIPESELGRSLSLEAVIGYTVPGLIDPAEFRTDFGGLLIPVTALPAIQIISVDAVAPNAPKVNAGQQFQISAVVANVSSTPASSLAIVLSSDGFSTFDAEPVIVDLDANGTTEVLWDVTAALDPNPAEIFFVDVEHSGITHLPPVDNVALVTIETPAELELTYSLFGVENGMIDYGNDLSLTVEVVNHGVGEASDTEYLLAVAGFDDNGPDTLDGRISIDKHIDFSFVVPQHDTALDLSFALVGIPTDLNSGSPAVIGDTAFDLSISVVSAEASLFIKTTPLGTNLVLPGRQKDIFQLDLTNTGISSATSLQLDRIVLLVRDTEGRPLEAMSIFSLGNTGFYENEQKVSGLTAGDSLLLFAFDQFIITPQASRSLVLKAEFRQTDMSSVALELANDGLVAHFTDGPSAGLAPGITSDVEEGEPLIASAFTIKAANLDGSFMIETNPFNPEDPTISPVRFTYELTDDAPMEFRILTVTGEEVYARNYASGGQGGTIGENIIYWDGCNGGGHVVFNGVYIAIIRNTDTDETARIKIAVVK